MKTIESRIAPNPKEAQIWIDLSADPHGLVRKYWNGKNWVERQNQNDDFSKLTADVKFLKEHLSLLYEEFAEIKNCVKVLQQQCADLNNLPATVNKLGARINKLEQFIITE